MPCHKESVCPCAWDRTILLLWQLWKDTHIRTLLTWSCSEEFLAMLSFYIINAHFCSLVYFCTTFFIYALFKFCFVKKKNDNRWIMLWNMFSQLYKTTFNNFCSHSHQCKFHVSSLSGLGINLAHIDTRLQLKPCIFHWVSCEQLNTVSGVSYCQH